MSTDALIPAGKPRRCRHCHRPIPKGPSYDGLGSRCAEDAGLVPHAVRVARPVRESDGPNLLDLIKIEGAIMPITDPWRMDEWNALPDECLIAACDNDDIDHRGPVWLRAQNGEPATMRKACTPHWEGIHMVLGEQAGWERTDGARQVAG